MADSNPPIAGTPMGWILEYTMVHPQLSNTAASLACASLTATELSNAKTNLIDIRLDQLLVGVSVIRYLVKNIDGTTGDPIWCDGLQKLLSKIEKIRKSATKQLQIEMIEEKELFDEDNKRITKLYKNIELMIKMKKSRGLNGNGFNQKLNSSIREYLYEQLYEEAEEEEKVEQNISYNRIESAMISDEILAIQLGENITKYVDVSLARILGSKDYRDIIGGIRDGDENDSLISKTVLSRICRMINDEKETKA